MDPIKSKRFLRKYLSTHQMKHYTCGEALKPETILRVYSARTGTEGKDIIAALYLRIAELEAIIKQG